jgi:hypothetical protein
MTTPHEFEDRRSTGELGRSIDRLATTVEKLDETVDRLRDDTVSRREFEQFKADVAKQFDGVTWLRRAVITGPLFAGCVYFMYRVFNAGGIGT